MHISHARDDVPAATSRAETSRSHFTIHLTSIWEYIVKTKTLPPNIHLESLYNEITRRLRDPEWEVRQHALRVLADVLVATDDYSYFPLKTVVDNLGHSSPTVRKAALDTLKVYVCDSSHPKEIVVKLLDRINNSKVLVTKDDSENNIMTGIILSIPSLMMLLRKRNMWDNSLFNAVLSTLGWRLFDVLHNDVAFKAMVKLKKFMGPKYFYEELSALDPKISDKYKLLCHLYDVEYDIRQEKELSPNYSNSLTGSDYTFRSTLSSVESENCSDENIDAAITLAVLEETMQNNTSQSNEESSDSCDKNELRISTDSEDSDLIVSTQKRVTFGGEVVKVRTPDSENASPTEEEERKQTKSVDSKYTSINKLPVTVPKKNSKKSGIPLPLISSKQRLPQKGNGALSEKFKKSKSLTEIHSAFKNIAGSSPILYEQTDSRRNSVLQFLPPEKIPSPVEPHREIEVLHNLQRSPMPSPPRARKVISIEEVTDDADIIFPLCMAPVNVIETTSNKMKTSYEWEKLNIIGKDVINQLHNTDNWISAVRAVDRLQRALTDPETAKALEVAGSSLVEHMWSLGVIVRSARAPAESVVCTLIRGGTISAVRHMLPSILPRLSTEPLPAALPLALLSQFSLPELVRIILEWVPNEANDQADVDQSRLQSLECVARVAGPAALLAAVRRALPDSSQANQFWRKLRERLRRPSENWDTSQKNRNLAVTRLPSLTKSERRRARSTPPPTARKVSVRVKRTLTDSAPPGGGIHQSTSAESLLPLVKFNPNKSSDLTPVECTQQVQGERKTPPSPAVSVHVDLNNIDHDFTVVITNEVLPSPRVMNYHVDEPDVPADNSGEVSISRRSSLGNISIGEVSHISNNSSASGKSVVNIEVITPASTPERKKSEKSRSPSPKSNQSNVIEVKDIPQEVNVNQHLSPRHVPVIHRDVSSELALYYSIPPRHEDWESIMVGLDKIESLAADKTATAPAGSWRAAIRAAASHVKSPRSKVARAACKTLGALFSHRGKDVELETDEAAGALFDRAADVNKFLRADAVEALTKLAFGVTSARAATVLAKRGASHRAGPARAAAAKVLSELASEAGGPAKLLKGQIDTRSLVLRAAADLLMDASPEARSHARKLMTALAEEPTFHALLKDSITPSKYKTIERNVDMLRTR